MQIKGRMSVLWVHACFLFQIIFKCKLSSFSFYVIVSVLITLTTIFVFTSSVLPRYFNVIAIMFKFTFNITVEKIMALGISIKICIWCEMFTNLSLNKTLIIGSNYCMRVFPEFAYHKILFPMSLNFI